jgi:hypothetical protein
MKKYSAMIVSAVVLVGTACAQSIPSQNAAGYIKHTLNRGELNLLASPFEKFDGNVPTIEDVVGTDILPAGTTIFFWDVDGQVYDSITYKDDFFFTGWDPALTAATPFPRGRGFFVSIPASAAEASYDLFFHGEVPDAQSAPTGTSVELRTGLQMVSFSYPVSIAITDPALKIGLPPADPSSVATAGDTVFSWDPAVGYGAMTYKNDFFSQGWDNPAFVFEAGKGYFYLSVGDKTWNELKPYAWP